MVDGGRFGRCVLLSFPSQLDPLMSMLFTRTRQRPKVSLVRCEACLSPVARLISPVVPKQGRMTEFPMSVGGLRLCTAVFQCCWLLVMVDWKTLGSARRTTTSAGLAGGTRVLCVSKIAIAYTDCFCTTKHPASPICFTELEILRLSQVPVAVCCCC